MKIFNLSLLIFAITLLTDCKAQPRFSASLDQTLGLEKGADVVIAGVEVGTVRKIKVKGSAAHVVFSVSARHEIKLHADACAIAVPFPEISFKLIKVKLIILPGKAGNLTAGNSIMQCSIYSGTLADSLSKLGINFGNFKNALASGDKNKVKCANLSFKLEKIKELRKSFHLPKGGHQLHFLIKNEGLQKVGFPNGGDVQILDEENISYTIKNDPGKTEWFMPFTMAGNTARRTSLVISKTTNKPTIKSLVFNNNQESCRYAVESSTSDSSSEKTSSQTTNTIKKPRTLSDLKKKYGSLSKVYTRDGKVYTGAYSRQGANTVIITLNGRISIPTGLVKRVAGGY